MDIAKYLKSDGHKIQMSVEKKKTEINNVLDTISTNISQQTARSNILYDKEIPHFSSLTEMCGKKHFGFDCNCEVASKECYSNEIIEGLEDDILVLKEQLLNSNRNASDRMKPEMFDIFKMLYDKIDLLGRISKNQKDTLLNLKNDLNERITKLSSGKEHLYHTISDQKIQLEISNRLNLEYQDSAKKLSDQLQMQLIMTKNLKKEVLDLKGAIRVFCRVRPPAKNETCKIKNNLEKLTISNDGNKEQNFQFDRIFSADETQEDIFRDVEPVIESGIEGYKICIFAYGQTGSGKTYTMEGNNESKGLIYRSIDRIFQILNILRGDGWKCEMFMNMVEIYNENIKDLLNENEKKIELKSLDEKVIISNCKEHAIEDHAEILKLMGLAYKNRSVGFTMANERSSRSHSVLILKIKMRNDSLKETREGDFTFIDLAGSERLNSSKAEGDRLKETQNINKSLSALGNVINALIRKDPHIPYRDSKLTYLLKEYLQGSSRILMFVNISPEFQHFNETTSSLRFASKVSECKLGAAQRTFQKEI